MAAIALKKRIYEAVDAIDDTSLLQAVYTILNKSAQHLELKPMSLVEFYARNERSKKEIKEGKLIDYKTIKARFSGKK